MMPQMAVRLEQGLGPQMQEPGEQLWQGEKKQLSKEQQQQQQGAGENGFPPQQHTHTTPAFSQLKKNGKCPQKQKRQPAPTQAIKKT
ncbi:hypothetical protein WISP_00068 [Willisornis vidua]|uniref:Uncharacterized protein n=1 Tax=Willisornis vidua TaxID=1566151 RepID=A0ABQ9E045_9PASS|nr:hypothetical protein WISP_00068 [Willisornis vidua]